MKGEGTTVMTAENWYQSVSGRMGPKFITGLRGVGKSAWLRQIDRLLAESGVAAERRLFIDTDDPRWRRYATCESLLDFISGALPSAGKSYVFIREAAALHDAAVVIGTLAASARYEIIATSSSKRLLAEGLARYFSEQIVHVELLPDTRHKTYRPDEARARWNEIFLSDVLAPNRVLDTALINRVAELLSDHLGESTSLRQISAAISPANRVLSPHTVERYLATLEDSHLVEKVFNYDLADRRRSARNYRFFFTDPDLRLAHFGPAPEDDARRMALNRAWLHLRRNFAEICCTDDKAVSFVTFEGKTSSGWQVDEKGVPVHVRMT